MINGHTLIEMGYKPGPWFSDAIRIGNDLGLGKDELRTLANVLMPPPAIEPFSNPINYSINISADNEYEQNNIDSVVETMDAVMKTPTVIGGAIMPDACPTGTIGQIPVGGIVVTKNAIHPSMHSADICCSVMMTNFGKVNPMVVMDAVHSVTHFGPGGRKEYSELPSWLEHSISQNKFLNDDRSISLSTSHLGTQGDGNHFAFIGVSEQTGDTMLVTHHGSRGFGAKLFKEGMRVAEGYRKKISPGTLKMNAWIPYDTDDGKEYWDALQIIRKWTKLNHETIHNAAADEFNGTVKDRIWNEHNFVFKDGDNFYHAKGATPLDEKFIPDSNNGLRLIPLNMAEPVLIVKGNTTKTNLGFAPHGAGRNVSRTEHKRIMSGMTDNEIYIKETKGLDIRFFSGKIDISELPSAYKNADTIQAQMKKFGLGNVVDRIMPYGSIMAGTISHKRK